MLLFPSEFWQQATYFLFSKGPTSNSDLNMNRTRDKRVETFQQSGLSQDNILGISFSFSVYFLFFDSSLGVYDKISFFSPNSTFYGGTLHLPNKSSSNFMLLCM